MQTASFELLTSGLILKEFLHVVVPFEVKY